MKRKVYKDFKVRDKVFEAGKTYELSTKEYRCLKHAGALDAPKKSKKETEPKSVQLDNNN